jgi:uncharacterized protein (DUF1499 family)
MEMRFMNVVARIAFAALVLAVIVGLVAAFGTSLHAWNYRTGLLKIFPFCLALGAAAFLLGLAWVVTALLFNSGMGARYGVTAFVGAIVLLAVPVDDMVMSRILPPIHDISTDNEHPPEFAALLTQRPGAENPPDYDGAKTVWMNGKASTVTALQKKYYPEVKPIGQLESTERLFGRALSTAKAMGWTIVAVDPDAGRIEATDTTFFFGFTDDIVIRVKPAGMGARLDIRSKSRVGQTDIGRNAARIKSFVKKLLANG